MLGPTPPAAKGILIRPSPKRQAANRLSLEGQWELADKTLTAQAERACREDLAAASTEIPSAFCRNCNSDDLYSRFSYRESSIPPAISRQQGELTTLHKSPCLRHAKGHRRSIGLRNRATAPAAHPERRREKSTTLVSDLGVEIWPEGLVSLGVAVTSASRRSTTSS